MVIHCSIHSLTRVPIAGLPDTRKTDKAFDSLSRLPMAAALATPRPALVTLRVWSFLHCSRSCARRRQTCQPQLGSLELARSQERTKYFTFEVNSGKSCISSNVCKLHLGGPSSPSAGSTSHTNAAQTRSLTFSSAAMSVSQHPASTATELSCERGDTARVLLLLLLLLLPPLDCWLRTQSATCNCSSCGNAPADMAAVSAVIAA